jgi:hypothetical protein
LKRRQPAIQGALTRNEVHDYFKGMLTGTKWERMRGMQTPCASKGLDQKRVQDWPRHMNEATSKCYRHLSPSPLSRKRSRATSDWKKPFPVIAKQLKVGHYPSGIGPAP